MEIASARVFNAQKDLRDIDVGLENEPKYTSDKYTFMLPHKHFDLLDGEVLWVTKRDRGWNASVKEFRSLGNDVAPCMWLHDNGWKPYAFADKNLGSIIAPDVAPGDFNLGMRWINCNGVENTDRKQRTQQMTERDAADEDEDYIVAVINYLGSKAHCKFCICCCAACK